MNHIKLYEDFSETADANFEKWFGGSKVVDSKGEPLVVYHGSQSSFTEFNGDAYFTDDWNNADGYAGGEHVYEVYLCIKKPFVLDAKGRKWDDLEEPHKSTQHVVGMVDRKRYDGVIINNVKDSWIDDADYQDPSTVYVAFEPTQIKSATDNEGTFDPRSKDITK